MESVSSTAAWHGCSWRSGLSNSVFELDEDSTRSEASKKQLSTRVRPSEQAHLQSLVTPWQRIRRLVTSIYQSIESNLSVEKPHYGFVWEEGATKKSRGWSSVSQHCHYGICFIFGPSRHWNSQANSLALWKLTGTKRQSEPTTSPQNGCSISIFLHPFPFHFLCSRWVGVKSIYIFYIPKLEKFFNIYIPKLGQT